jgi:flagellar biosynthesis regulator FlaF
MTDDAFQSYVDKRTPLRAAEIRAKLAAGDKELTAQMDDAIGALLFDSAQWAGLIQATARGENAFAKVLDKAIEDAAEVLALKDAEAAEHDHENERAAYQFDMARLFPSFAGAPM